MDEKRKAEIKSAFGGRAYARLFAAVRSRVERGDESQRSVTLDGLSTQEREAIANLFGLHDLPGEIYRVRIDLLEQTLSASRLAATVKQVLEALGGPLANRRQERLDSETSKKTFWDAAKKHPLASRLPFYNDWLDDLRKARVYDPEAPADSTRLLDLAISAVVRLPEAGISRSVLAAEIAGDAHALDYGERLSVMVLRAAARMTGAGFEPSAGAQRSLWDQVGVSCDPLSSDVIILGLRTLGDSYLDNFLNASAQKGVPVKLTLQQVRLLDVKVAPGTSVFVCENPAVVAHVSDHLGPDCAALVCTNGIATSAVNKLLTGLKACNALISFHGDFDWGGIRIMNHLYSKFEGTPWRFGAREYEEAIRKGLGHSNLEPKPVKALWDPKLHDAMVSGRKKIHEEKLVADLLQDLSR